MQNQNKKTNLNATQVKKLFNRTQNNNIIYINIDNINNKYKIILEGELIMAKKSALEIHIEESNKRFDTLEKHNEAANKRFDSLEKHNIEANKRFDALEKGMEKILKALNIN